MSEVPYGKISRPTDIGAVIRAHRRAEGLKQEEVADRVGVGARFVSEVERGKATAELGKVLKLLERLGLDVWIVRRGDTPGDPLA